MATDYDELRTDVKESQENSLEALKSAKASDAKSVVQELDEADALDGLTPGGEFIAEELIVQVTLGDPEAMLRAVRVFIGEETFCPGFQLKDGLFQEPVLRLFDLAMRLKIPHNVFAAWMVSPLPAAARSRPVDMLGSMVPLQTSLVAFGDRYGRSKNARDCFCAVNTLEASPLTAPEERRDPSRSIAAKLTSNGRKQRHAVRRHTGDPQRETVGNRFG